MSIADRKSLNIVLGVAVLGAQIGVTQAASVITWKTVANNGDIMPGSDKVFNSYNQPAVNANGLVVFRARSQGGEGGGDGGESGSTALISQDAEGNQPIHGIYTRNMAAFNSKVTKWAARGDAVPSPNNTNAAFKEFPSTPRIDLVSSLIATRGQSDPIWNYVLDDGSETKIGTSGIFASSTGAPKTAVDQLGVVSDYAYFQVPDAPASTKFDQFPGSPSPNGRSMVVFKGNYSDGGVSKTGVYYRDFVASVGKASVVKLANSNTVIPN